MHSTKDLNNLPSKGVYYCPMHPEIIRDAPGSCPICGMSLISSDRKAIEGSNTSLANHEYDDFRFKLLIGTLLFLPVLYFSMQDSPFSTFIQVVFTSVIVIWCGSFIYRRAWDSLLTKNLNMFTLIALGTGVSYIFSLFSAFFPTFFAIFGQKAPLYFESAGAITLLVILGQLLEMKAQAKTNEAVQQLLEKGAKTAILLRNGDEVEIPVDQVQPGDFLRVKPSSKVPVDGTVTEGKSDIDESMLTGEPLTVEKLKGSKVFAGSLNQTGSFVMQAQKVGSDTLLFRIVQMVKEAEMSRAPIQKLADTVSGYFVPAVLLISFITAGAWIFFAGSSAWREAFLSAISVLIIACPCALGLAAPMSMTVGMGRGAKLGVLIKNAEAMENLEKIQTLVFDKTGTLTEGKPVIFKINPEAGFSENTLLQLGASLETLSEHPLASAIVNAAKKTLLNLLKVEDFNATPGSGIAGAVEGKTILIGKKDFLNQHLKSPVPKIEEPTTRAGVSELLIAIDGTYAGSFELQDELKDSAKETILDLEEMGLKLILLSGDKPEAVKNIAEKLKLTHWKGGQTPADKYDFILSEKKITPIAMAGDGVNDAPALAAATVGIAMGTGSDAAIESASVTLLKGDLSGIKKAIALSRSTMQNIRQNLFLAFAYNVAAIPLAAGLLYPFTGWLLSPMVAAAAMTLSSLSVILNALRLK